MYGWRCVYCSLNGSALLMLIRSPLDCCNVTVPTLMSSQAVFQKNGSCMIRVFGSKNSDSVRGGYAGLPLAALSTLTQLRVEHISRADETGGCVHTEGGVWDGCGS